MRLAVLLLAAAVLVGGCGSDPGSKVTPRALEQQIRPALREQLQHRTGAARVSVRTVSCVKQSRSEASCLAHVAASDGSDATLAIRADIDPDTGNVIWRVTQ